MAEIEHDLSGLECWCMPHALPSPGSMVVIVHHHNSPCEVCAGNYEEEMCH